MMYETYYLPSHPNDTNPPTTKIRYLRTSKTEGVLCIRYIPRDESAAMLGADTRGLRE